jgi:hypothetical protein
MRGTGAWTLGDQEGAISAMLAWPVLNIGDNTAPDSIHDIAVYHARSLRRVNLCGVNEQQAEKWMGQQPTVRVIAFSREECPFDSTAEHTWQEWHSFRNQVLDILTRYGSVGQMDKMPILDTYEESKDGWRAGSKKPDFFVVDDDIYRNSVRVEADCTLVKAVLLDELLMLLAQLRAWSVYLALIKGGLWVFHDRILFEGHFFADCCSVADLYHRCALGGDAPSSKC